MGYTVQYGPESAAETAWKRKAGRKGRRFLLLLTILCAAAVFAVSGWTEDLGDLLIPGDPEVTKAAFSQLTEDLREGDPFRDAVITFCREIIDHAEVS